LKKTVPWCVENNCGILAYSPLQRGLLTGKITPETSFAPGAAAFTLSTEEMNQIFASLEQLNLDPS